MKELRGPLPLACRMGALSAAQRERRGAVLASLSSRLLEMRELPDGLVFLLPGDAWIAAAEFVSLERLCCPFLGFTLEQEPRGKCLRLQLRGLTDRDGLKEFLRKELSL